MKIKNLKTLIFILHKYIKAYITMIAIMIIIGGITRITKSGLSVITWQPINELIPTINKEKWKELFKKYQKSPEYINSNINLTQFKKIFFIESLHRNWGKITFIVFVYINLLAITDKKMKKIFLKPLTKISSFFILQGVIGFFMVRSGLTQNPYVNPYILNCHLLIGLIILFLSIKLETTIKNKNFNKNKLIPLITILTAIFGNLMAGVKSKFISNSILHTNTTKLYIFKPIITNLFLNPITISFFHKILTLYLIILIISLSKNKKQNKRKSKIIFSLLTIQIIIGMINIKYNLILIQILHLTLGVIILSAVIT